MTGETAKPDAADYLFYCRDLPDTGALLRQFTEAHWSFMDGYAERLIARGPSLTEDGGQHTGSLHIVGLDTVEETDVFAYQEPYYKAGLYGEVIIRRWRNLLFGTMWDFKTASDDPFFLVLAHARSGVAASEADFAGARQTLLAEYVDRMPVFGSMFSVDDTSWLGLALVVQSPSRKTVEAMIAAAFARAPDTIATIEIHRWRMGGRR